MNLENQVCLLQQAKRLKDLGVKQDSLFYHTNSDNWGVMPKRSIDFTGNPFSAFTVAELGMMLPNAFDTMAISVSQNVRGWAAYDDNGNDVFKDEVNFSTEAEARAAMLIYLLENNLVTAGEVNARLTQTT